MGVGGGGWENLFELLLQLSVKCEMISKKKWSYFGGTLLSRHRMKVFAVEGGRGLMHACILSYFSNVQLFATSSTLARQCPLSMGFSRQEYRSGLPCSLPGDLPNPGIEPASLMSPVLAGGFFTTSTTWEAQGPV